MTRLADALRRFVSDLRDRNVHFALRTADAETISVARERLALISQRGYSRGRDLESMLAAFISRFRPDSAP
jgi:hypothetical protein